MQGRSADRAGKQEGTSECPLSRASHRELLRLEPAPEHPHRLWVMLISSLEWMESLLVKKHQADRIQNGKYHQ